MKENGMIKLKNKKFLIFQHIIFLMKGYTNYKTKSNREIVIAYYFDTIDPCKVPTNKEKFDEACKNGCKNYNNKWCCPPYSPSFNKLVHKKNMLVVLLSVKGEYFNDCSEWNKVRAINSILKSKLDKIIRKLENLLDGYSYISGSCRLCRTCAKKSNMPCRHPKNLRYSLESVGIDCNKLTEILFNMKLCWYIKGGKYKYGSVLSAVETDMVINNKEVENVILSTIHA